jgi:DNA (cytosine-5)-methyltransferase 1
MNHGSLFSGIGGFDLAAEWMGWDNIFHCEWNDFGKKVLNYYWPKSISYHDITKTDFTIHRGRIDVLTGGFPCQPYSTAGKRLGKEDERHLWPEMLRAIREIKPRWIVGENVLGLVSWNGGMVFEEVCAELEAEGYEVQPYVLPAAGVNAPHQRYRVWFVAHSYNARANEQMRDNREWQEKDKGWQEQSQSEFGKSSYNDVAHSKDGGCRGRFSEECADGERKIFQREQGGCEMGSEVERCNREWDAKDTNSIGQEWRLHQNESKNAIREFTSKSNARINERKGWDNFPTQAPICNGDDGLSDRLDAITFPKWRSESIKAGGNAIVPQVAYQIFKAIQNYENQIKLF